MIRRRLLGLCVLTLVSLGLGAPFACAADAEPVAVPTQEVAPVPWSSLNPAQQKLLEKQGANWDQLPAGRQQALAQGAARWLEMDPAARANAQTRFRNFQALPSQRKELIRRRWQQFQTLGPAQQQRIRENFRAFKGLPAGQREALRQQWQTADRTQRKQMLQELRRQRAQQRAAHPP